MAQVWVVSQHGKHGFEKLFALKSIHPRFADDPGFRAMFLDEARIASAIQHPNVAQVFDLGEAQHLLYLVMEYVEGESLSALCASAARRAGGALNIPIEVALRITADIAAGLHNAHRLKAPNGELRNVVHRDVSPHNVLLSVKGEVKVIDFGIAHAKDRWAHDTDPNGVKGKAGYMAPEQARRQPVSPATDVFGLGCTLYKLLAGHPPFWGGNDVTTLARLLSGPPPDPLPENVPPIVRAIVERAIELEPGDRYASAQEMKNAIEVAIAEEGYVPNVAGWVNANLSERARERQALLANRGTMTTPPSVETLTPPKRTPSSAAVPAEVPELGPIPARAARAPSPVPPPPEQIVLQHMRPRRPEPEETKTPGFMDVRALVARAAAPNERHAAPAPIAALPPPQPEPRVAEAREQPRQEEKREFVPKPRPKPKSEIEQKGSSWIKLAIAAIVVVLVIVGFLLVLPRIIKDRAIATARSAGVTLTIDRVSVRLGGFTLHDVNAVAPLIPGAKVHAQEIESVGFSGKEMRVRGADVELNGSLRETNDAVTQVLDGARALLAGTAAEPKKVAVGPARLTWNGVFGPGTRIQAGDVGLDLESRGVGHEDYHGVIGRFDVTTAKTTFGVWSATFEDVSGAGRVRLLFDPAVPDGPSLLVVWGKSAPFHVTVKIRRSPLSHLGIRPADLSLPADPTSELEVQGEGGKTVNGRIELSVSAELHGARLPNVKTPVDLKLAANLEGAAGKPLYFERTTLTVGPFVVLVDGTLTPADLGFHLDATWKTQPIPCEKIVRAEAKNWGPLASMIQDLAHTTGVARVTGTASASGLVTYDTSAPDEAQMTWLTKESCGLSLFGL